MRTWAWRLAVVGSALVVLALVASYLLSRSLPEFHEDRSGCYWTDALIVFVECAEEVVAGDLRAWAYTAWLLVLFYAPIFGPMGMMTSLWYGLLGAFLWSLGATGLALVGWGVIVVLAVAGWRWARGLVTGS